MDIVSILKNGGATLTKALKSAKHKTGFYASMRGGEVYTINERLSLNFIAHIIKERAKDLAPKTYLGIWVHKGEVFIDRTRHFKTLKAAVNFGKLHEQLAVYDIKTGKSVEL